MRPLPEDYYASFSYSGPNCHNNELPASTQQTVDELNKNIPRPLLRPNEETVPKSALAGADGNFRLPRSIAERFLTVGQKQQLVTIFRNMVAAEIYLEHIRLKALGAKRKLRSLRMMKNEELFNLCKLHFVPIPKPTKQVKKGAAAYHAIENKATDVSNTARSALVNLCLVLPLHLVGLLDTFLDYIVSPDERKLSFLLLLDENEERPDYFISEVPVSVLQAAAANVNLGAKMKASFAAGQFYSAPPGSQIHVYDPDHLHHNIVQALVKQQLADLDDGHSSEGCVLAISRLIEAALKTGDGTLTEILRRNFDLHSHAATRYVLTHKGLVKKLEALGYGREAVILKILGMNCEAWSMPHQTEAARTQALHLTALLVYRLFGDGIGSAQCLGRAQFGGIPLKQWLELLYNADARKQIVTSLTGAQRRSFCEGSITTRLNESYFSQQASSNTAGMKANVLTVQQRSHQHDVVFDFKLKAQEDDSPFANRVSKRQRKDGGMGYQKWNDGSFFRAKHDHDLQTRARQHTGGHSNYTTRDLVKFKTGA